MRVLTVRQPWAWAIVHGGKDVENRVRNIAGNYRGPVAIHAGLTFDLDAPKAVQGDFADHPYAHNEDAFGAILGVVDLVYVHWGDRTCSPWSEAGAFHLVLANPRPLVEPIPFRGALGLRTLPADVEARILAEVS